MGVGVDDGEKPKKPDKVATAARKERGRGKKIMEMGGKRVNGGCKASKEGESGGSYRKLDREGGGNEVATAAAKKRERGEGDGRMKGRGWQHCGRRSNKEEGRVGGITGRIRERDPDHGSKPKTNDTEFVTRSVTRSTIHSDPKPKTAWTRLVPPHRQQPILGTSAGGELRVQNQRYRGILLYEENVEDEDEEKKENDGSHRLLKKPSLALCVHGGVVALL
ncbi:hypothetical protein TIFTF001_031235 [Ficus carica]|uniref:Uncharacterized protein n=1 Tax=Ficus carica TaxID=3494 RepID=A0AA88DUZ6_FICCA|nr:hypothetical protein TIFTF001_031235 [Ficus carica]